MGLLLEARSGHLHHPAQGLDLRAGPVAERSGRDRLQANNELGDAESEDGVRGFFVGRVHEEDLILACLVDKGSIYLLFSFRLKAWS